MDESVYVVVLAFFSSKEYEEAENIIFLMGNVVSLSALVLLTMVSSII